MSDDRDIIVKNLSYVYPDGTPALKDVCFEITKGENVALVGQNGAGKSTLLLHLNGVIENNNGRITIAGKQLDKKNVPDIRKKVGVVFQDPDDQLFMSTVFDDVAFGPINMGFSEETVKERVKKSLQKVGLSGFEERCPHHLSFGEKKRISVATVLSMTPAILLLDEPTSNLDPGGRRNIIETLKTLDSTKIIASHDIESLLEICDKAILMDKGRVVATGRSEEILTDIELLNSHGLEAPSIVKMLGDDVIPLLRNNFGSSQIKKHEKTLKKAISKKRKKEIFCK
jgi:cobalt/nickel transport system ATP-binding protein